METIKFTDFLNGRAPADKLDAYIKENAEYMSEMLQDCVRYQDIATFELLMTSYGAKIDTNVTDYLFKLELSDSFASVAVWFLTASDFRENIAVALLSTDINEYFIEKLFTISPFYVFTDNDDIVDVCTRFLYPPHHLPNYHLVFAKRLKAWFEVQNFTPTFPDEHFLLTYYFNSEILTPDSLPYVYIDLLP